MKPSDEKAILWIRTKGQLNEAEKKLMTRNENEMRNFLRNRSNEITFQLDSKRRRILVNKKTGKPLEMNETLIDDIAVKINLLSGKWLIFIQKEKVDGLWENIEKLATKGKIWNAKVSTLGHPGAAKGTHVICVYTKNYLDKENVMDTREILRQIGINKRLNYKPDIYTILGIYSDNKKDFKLNRVTRYIS